MTFFEKESTMESNTDQKKITRLLLLGFIAGIVALIGDLLLGWGTYDPALSGLARKLSIYDGISDTRIFWSARLHLAGTFGYMIFAGARNNHLPDLFHSPKRSSYLCLYQRAYTISKVVLPVLCAGGNAAFGTHRKDRQLQYNKCDPLCLDQYRKSVYVPGTFDNGEKFCNA